MEHGPETALRCAQRQFHAWVRDERGTEVIEFLVLTGTVILATYVLLITLGKEMAGVFSRLVTQFFR